MLGGGTEQRLPEEEQRDHEEEPRGGALGGGHLDLARLPEGQRRRLGALPPDLLAPPPVQGEEHPGTQEQGGQGQCAPHEQVGRRGVVDELFRRPVVGVRVVVPRALCGGAPGGPGEEGRQLVDVRRVGDHVRDQPVLRGRRAEEVRVVALDVLEGPYLQVGQHQGPGVRVVAVGPHDLDELAAGVLDAGGLELVEDEQRRAAQVVGGVVRAEVSAVTHDRAVLLQATAQEDLLTGRDVRTGEDDLALGVDHLLGLRHRVGVGAQGQQAHDEEPEEHHQGHALDPPLRDHQLRARARPFQVRRRPCHVVLLWIDHESRS